MSSGPIEWLGEEPGHEVPSTEMGGGDGLIQNFPPSGELVAADGMPIRHDLTASEIRGVMARKASVPVDVSARNEDAVRAAEDDAGVVDPHTLRVLEDEDINRDVTGQAGREHGLGEGMIQ